MTLTLLRITGLVIILIILLNNVYQKMTCDVSEKLQSFRQRKSLLLSKLDRCSDMAKLMSIRSGIDELNSWAYDNVIEKRGYENRIISRRLEKEARLLEREYRKRFEILKQQKIYGVVSA